MKPLIAIVVVVAAIFGGWKLLEYWDDVQRDREEKEKAATTQLDGRTLPGVPYQLEEPLQQAYKKGAAGLKDWLERAKRSPQITDPRLAFVELDYVVLIHSKDPVEAKRIFAEVKQRTPPDSKINKRIKLMEKTME